MIHQFLGELRWIRTLFRSDFAILHIQNVATLLDTTEEHKEELLQIHDFLKELHPTDLIYSQGCNSSFEKELANRFNPFNKIAGLLHLPISVDGSSFACFLRLKETQVLRWGGNPSEAFSYNLQENCFDPRSSFTIFTERVEDVTEPWSSQEVALGNMLRAIYTKFLLIWQESEKASQLDLLKNMLIAHISHDIRTPLNAIINFLEMSLEFPLDADLLENIQKSYDASHNLMVLVNDLLDLTRFVS